MRNQCVLLCSRPTGVAKAGDFEIVDRDIVLPAEGEILVRNRFLSVEPAMRGWIADVGNYSTPVPIGSVMRSLAVGEIIESRHPAWQSGDVVCGWFGWQSFATVPASAIVRKVSQTDLPHSLALGVLGINGVTALLALRSVGRPKEDDTVVVSTAAGGVGSAVGQLAKLAGCRTVGITGSDDKARMCVEQFGYDAAINYRDPQMEELLRAACPDGVDIYYDNTAGAISDMVLRHLAIGARLIVCGTASVFDWSDWPMGPRVERHLLVKRASMSGFVIFDHDAEYDGAVAELAELVRSGQLHYQEHVLQGIERCPDAIAMLYRGENKGKLVVAL
ncbi:NADP-dependent oxidoreductase [Sphingobium sp. TomTYG45]